MAPQSSTSEVSAEFVPILDDQLFEHAERVRDKVVLITGASSGIGKETATRFASFGARIVIGDLDFAGAEQTVADIIALGGQAVSRKCDVTVWDDQVALFELAIEKFGSVDVVVPNAGIGEPESYLDVTFDQAGKPRKPALSTIQVNLVGVMYTTYLAQHYLLINREPDTKPLKSIVLIGSMSSWHPFPLAPVYTATKHGILGLMRALDPILALRGIRIACITPFFADTGILPTIVKIGLAGVPLTPVPRIAGAIINAAADPDPATSGSGYVLPDNGPVFKVPREEFKLGVYKLLDDRANALLNVGSSVAYAVKTVIDITKIIGKPVFASVIALGIARACWIYRDNIRQFVKI